MIKKNMSDSWWFQMEDIARILDLSPDVLIMRCKGCQTFYKVRRTPPVPVTIGEQVFAPADALLLLLSQMKSAKAKSLLDWLTNTVLPWVVNLRVHSVNLTSPPLPTEQLELPYPPAWRSDHAHRK